MSSQYVPLKNRHCEIALTFSKTGCSHVQRQEPEGLGDESVAKLDKGLGKIPAARGTEFMGHH